MNSEAFLGLEWLVTELANLSCNVVSHNEDSTEVSMQVHERGRMRLMFVVKIMRDIMYL